MVHFLYTLVRIYGSSFSLYTQCVYLLSSLISHFLHGLCAYFKKYPFTGVLTGMLIKQSSRMMVLFQSMFKCVKLTVKAFKMPCALCVDKMQPFFFSCPPSFARSIFSSSLSRGVDFFHSETSQGSYMSTPYPCSLAEGHRL